MGVVIVTDSICLLLMYFKSCFRVKISVSLTTLTQSPSFSNRATFYFKDLGQYDNIVVGAAVVGSNSNDGTKTVDGEVVTYGELIDNKYDTGYVFEAAQLGPQEQIKLVVTFKSPGDGEDSYGINKLFIFSKKDLPSVTGWKVYFKSIPRNGAEWPCQRNDGTGEAVPSTGKRTEKWDGWEAEIECGPNTQTKSLILIHNSARDYKLNELRVAGLQSSKYECDLGWKPGTQTCSRCPQGQIGVKEGESEPRCEDCPAGSFSAYLDTFEPILECSECSSGKYSEAGSSTCTDCEPGTYQDVPGSSSCKICVAGTFQALAGKTGFEQCEPGYFSLDRSSECSACAVGSFASISGSAECTECSPGEYQKDRGQKFCLGCKAGTFSNDFGADSCTLCPKGQFNNAASQSSCTECEAGEYQSLEGQTECIKCNVGTFNNENGQDSCDPCPVGMFLDASGGTVCKVCEPGQYQDVTGSIDCKLCPPLKYQDQQGASQCIDCEQGEISFEGAITCTSCKAGTYLDFETKTCMDCPRGSYSEERAVSCIQCDFMFYQPMKGSVSCIPCEAGTITEEKGSVKCKQCERGTHRSTDNSEPVCEPCQPGFFSGQLGLAECEPCPTGTYSNGQAIECDKCEKGKFQSETGQETCELCPPGSFSDEEGLSECTPCKVDTVASEGGSTSCVACSYGFYSPQEAGKKCLACPKRAAYQPPSCPPIIPNCPAQQFTNQYGTFKFPEMEPPGDGSGKAHEQKCEFALYVNDEKVFSNITSECQTWFESGVQKSEWTTPSYAKCGTVKTEILYNQTKAAREAIKEAESSGKSAAEATVDPSVATSMLSGLMGALGTPAPDPTKPDPDPTNPNNSTNPDQTDAKENEKEEGGLGAADTASVVNTLSVVANSVPPEVLANPENQKNILGAINSFAEQDGDFVQDAGTETASAAVNVVNSIGASMFAAVEEPETPTDSSSGGDGENGGTKPKKKKMKEIKTDTMTILPTPMNEETLSKSVILDFGNDEEEEEEETELDDAISDGAKNEEPAEQELPATEAPVIPDPVQSEGEEPAPTAAPALSIVRATKPPPVKKIVMVEMPPLSNLVTASGGENSDAKGLVCVVFETPALFPTKKVADNSTSTKKPKKGVVEPKVVSKVVLLTFGSKSISNINPPLALNFTKDEPEDYDPVTQDVQYKCVYYHKETNSWKSDGCTTTSVDKTRGGQVSCSCNHMTSFAILMSLEPIPDYLEVIQSQITTPLLAFSLFCLLVMIGTILPFKQLRSTRSMKIHLSLAGSQCFAIIIFLLTNLDGIVSEDVPIVCKGIAIMMDYTYLVVFMWTLVESVIMYISLVQVFGGHISKYMLKFNLFCWITPLLSPLTDYFLTEGILLEDGKCVVDLGVRKWSFILPIAVILGINFFIFVTLLRVIANTKNPDKSKTENTMKQLKAVASISCMLGLGWILGFFMVGPIAPYFQFAFILINGLQGLFMFLFYCVGNEQYMDLWKSKFGLKTSKSNSNSNSAAAGRKSVATTASNVRPSTVQASSSVVPATPAPAPAAAKPAPPSASLNPGAAPRANRRTSRAQAQAKIEEEAKKLEHQDSIGSAIYENENVYDIIDDPEIKAMSPASGSATITRL